MLALEGEGPAPKSQENTVFISYAREDSDAAKRFRKDLKDAGLNPWLDKECLIGGQNWKISIKNAIKKSRYFIPLFSSISIKKRGYVQNEFKYALEVFDEFPESQIFVIPCRLDDCEIPYDKLKDIEYVDLFPNWEGGVRRITQAIGVVTSESQKVTSEPRGVKRPGRLKIFISYSRSDAHEIAERIQEVFIGLEYDVYPDIDDSIRAERKRDGWNPTIARNISSCDIFIVIVTYGALYSPHVQDEVVQALRQNKRIVPCLYRGQKLRHDEIPWGLDKIPGIEFDNTSCPCAIVKS